MRKVLITGTGKAGSSWTIRGEQLGEAIGAHVVPRAPLDVCKAADLIVVVKRAGGEILAPVQASGRPWVWDVVDAWPQRAGQDMEERMAKRWLRAHLQGLNPQGVVWPTQRMRDDAAWSGRQLVLRHHAWPRYTPRPLAERVVVVGYEGARHYLGRWDRIVHEACARRGWRFEINGDLAQADIGIALRDLGGYAAAHWKSNCKLANVQALGIPALCSPEAGYRETAAGGECWIESEEDLVAAFDRLACYEERAAVRAQMLSAAPGLEALAATYRRWLDAL